MRTKQVTSAHSLGSPATGTKKMKHGVVGPACRLKSNARQFASSSHACAHCETPRPDSTSTLAPSPSQLGPRQQPSVAT
eukprot:3146484-Pleurochrysis_carterae.AAC.2